VNALVIDHLSRTLMLVLYLSAPPLVVATAVGLIVGLLQAVTQIQDQTLPRALKLVAILVVVVSLGPLLSGSLVQDMSVILDQIALNDVR
jgi:type III secretion protein S